MKVQFSHERLTEVLDTLLEMYRNKIYPFNRKDAVEPQTLIPAKIRADKRELALFYFFACIYMRGGVVSMTVFKQLLRMREIAPWMFMPEEVVKRSVEEVQAVLRMFIGWDSAAAGLYWHRNAQLLLRNWFGDPLNIIQETRNYKDALNFYLNKDKKDSKHGDLLRKKPRYAGFWGHQQKMVSMQVFFADWEGLYAKRFIYPGPVDFHNYRLLLTTGVIKITGAGPYVNFSEKISKPARIGLVRYMVRNNVDPLDVGAVMWLFSLLMCGKSPHTITKEANKRPAPLFDPHKLEEKWDYPSWASGKIKALNRTCHVCVFNRDCKYAIPAGPYYGKRRSGEMGGKLWLNPRPPLTHYLSPSHIDPSILDALAEDEELLDELF